MTDDYGTCKDCRFWEANASGWDGFCRRHAPRPMLAGQAPRVTDHMGVLVLPRTEADEWCGEHQYRPKPPAP